MARLTQEQVDAKYAEIFKDLKGLYNSVKNEVSQMRLSLIQSAPFVSYTRDTYRVPSDNRVQRNNDIETTIDKQLDQILRDVDDYVSCIESPDIYNENPDDITRRFNKATRAISSLKHMKSGVDFDSLDRTINRIETIRKEINSAQAEINADNATAARIAKERKTAAERILANIAKAFKHMLSYILAGPRAMLDFATKALDAAAKGLSKSNPLSGLSKKTHIFTGKNKGDATVKQQTTESKKRPNPKDST